MRSRVIILACCEDWSEHCAQQAVRTSEFFSSHFEGETLNLLSTEKMQKQVRKTDLAAYKVRFNETVGH
jgi:hypothetical protein